MRVLHVMESTIGGTRRHLRDVALGQLERGLEVFLAVSTLRDPDFPADLAVLEAAGATVARVPMLREISPLVDSRHALELARLLRRVRPDVVHTHSSKAGALGRGASLATRIGARVHTPHTFAFLFDALFGPTKRRVLRAVEARLASATDRVVAVSPSEAETFRRSGVIPAERVRVVCNGIDPAAYEDVLPYDLRSLGLDPSRPTAAVIGLLYEAKGQDLALEALACAGCESLQLLIVGPGDARALERAAARLGLADRVRFLGPRRDVPALLATLDFLVLPSRWEGMPYIVLEAMASRLPVVATPVDGARDLIVDGRTGWLAAAVSSEALSAAMARAASLGRDARANLGDEGHRRLVELFSAERMVDQLVDVYREVT